jgi:hypothetical protein
MTKESLKGGAPESWLCVDCGVNTAPGMLNRAELEKAIALAKLMGKWGPGVGDTGVELVITAQSEVYAVRDKVWKAAGMDSSGGCLCIGCLEKRIGRKLRPKDFPRDHTFNNPHFPGTPRLMKRRKGEGRVI